MRNLYSITTDQEAIRALFCLVNRYAGNLAPMPGVFSDYPAPVVRYVGTGRELVLMRWGMPPPPRTGRPPVTSIRNTSSPHWRGWLKPENRCLVPFNSFAEYEMRFAYLKRILKLGRLRLRGPRGAQDEFVLAAIAQNLRRLASLVARRRHPLRLCALRSVRVA